MQKQSKEQKKQVDSDCLRDFYAVDGIDRIKYGVARVCRSKWQPIPLYVSDLFLDDPYCGKAVQRTGCNFRARRQAAEKKKRIAQKLIAGIFITAVVCIAFYQYQKMDRLSDEKECGLT